VNFHHTDSGFTFLSNIEGSVEINDPIDEPAGEVNPLVFESKVVTLECLPSTSQSDLNDVSMEVLDLADSSKIALLPTLKINISQNNQDYNRNVLKLLPCPLFFMLVAELTVSATPVYRRYYNPPDVFKYKMTWLKPIEDATPENPDIVSNLYKKFKLERQPVRNSFWGGVYHAQQPRDYIENFELEQSVQVHLCASFTKTKDINQPYLMVFPTCISYQSSRSSAMCYLLNLMKRPMNYSRIQPHVPLAKITLPYSISLLKSKKGTYCLHLERKKAR
jgi:hypothetical protein